MSNVYNFLSFISGSLAGLNLITLISIAYYPDVSIGSDSTAFQGSIFIVGLLLLLIITDLLLKIRGNRDREQKIVLAFFTLFFTTLTICGYLTNCIMFNQCGAKKLIDVVDYKVSTVLFLNFLCCIDFVITCLFVLFIHIVIGCIPRDPINEERYNENEMV